MIHTNIKHSEPGLYYNNNNNTGCVHQEKINVGNRFIF